jgi:hypothetical protein
VRKPTQGIKLLGKQDSEIFFSTTGLQIISFQQNTLSIYILKKGFLCGDVFFSFFQNNRPDFFDLGLAFTKT